MPPSRANRTPDRRQLAERKGRQAEALAALYLRLKGYGIVSSRYKTPRGEIDLIARRGRTLVIVEVKHRSRADALGVADALGAVNSRRLIAAAEWFIASHRAYEGYDFRFDVIALAPGRWPYHLVNAFTA